MLYDHFMIDTRFFTIVSAVGLIMVVLAGVLALTLWAAGAGRWSSSCPSYRHRDSD